jgi:hypothetical protein
MGTNSSAGYGVEGMSKANARLAVITAHASTSTSNGRAVIAARNRTFAENRYENPFDAELKALVTL